MRERETTAPARGLARLARGAPALLLAACFPAVHVTAPPATAPASLVALAGASVMVGAGDIADCTSPGDRQTAALVDSITRADSVAGVDDVVFTLGDNVYPNGAEVNFDRCWDSSWGDTTRHIMQEIRPSMGNHDLDTEGGSAYYATFGDKAGPRGKGFYSYDIGEWHAVVLNSEIAVDPRFPVEARRAQEKWLRSDLAGNKATCTIAYLHRPRFSSGGHGGDVRMTALWKILYDGGVDLVLSGHDHDYERFAPQTPAGLADTAKGVTQIVVGTGGADLRGIRSPRAPNSRRVIQGHFGVLKLTLGSDEYQHVFIDTSGRIWDPGAAKCH